MRVNQRPQKQKISYQALETKYNQKTNVLSKTLIFPLIPIFALLFYVLFFKKRKYLVQHAVVATHFWAFKSDPAGCDSSPCFGAADSLVQGLERIRCTCHQR